MKKAASLLLRLTSMSVACSVLMSRTVFAEPLLNEEKYQWFLSRLPIWAVYGLVLGAVAGWGWLRRIKYAPEELSIDRKVLRAFFWSLVSSIVLFIISMCLDLWLFREFESTSLSFTEALSETLHGWYWLALTGLGILTFYVGVILFTRGPFSGRYALLPRTKDE